MSDIFLKVGSYEGIASAANFAVNLRYFSNFCINTFEIIVLTSWVMAYKPYDLYSFPAGFCTDCKR